MPRPEKPKKNKFEGENIEVADTPMYRSYGKAKKVYPWLEKLKDFLLRGLALYYLLFFAAIGALILFVMIVFSDILAFFIALIAGISALIILTAIPRKRLSFLRRLKKLCKKHNYTLTFNRRFFACLSFEKEAKADFILNTGSHVYYVKFATATKRNSEFIFFSSTEMLYRKLRLNNKITLIFDLKPKTKKIDIRFPKEAFEENATAVILLNPVPHDIHVKERDGSTSATGDGENRFGYTVHSGTGFISAIARNENSHSQ